MSCVEGHCRKSAFGMARRFAGVSIGMLGTTGIYIDVVGFHFFRQRIPEGQRTGLGSGVERSASRPSIRRARSDIYQASAILPDHPRQDSPSHRPGRAQIQVHHLVVSGRIGLPQIAAASISAGSLHHQCIRGAVPCDDVGNESASGTFIVASSCVSIELALGEAASSRPRIVAALGKGDFDARAGGAETPS